MTALAVSVIIVSRDRPDALLRCLTGLEQLFFDRFEIIVVADPAGVSAMAASRFDGAIKTVGFDAANISAARNLGLGLAAGQIVAFIDDDSVPEPTWLDHLIPAFDDPTVMAAGGFVRGRNGISFQNRARRVNHLGQHRDITTTDAPQILQSHPGDAVKTEGTNCAFRRDVLLAMGGFDPAFHFYLDETDVNLRLAAQNATIAIVPLAQVHHGFAASAQRHASRMPRSLFDIGASLLVFLRKHADPAEISDVLTGMRGEQRARLMRHMVQGTCEPRDIARLMQTLEDGFAAGRTRPIEVPVAIPATSQPMLPYATFGAAPARALCGRSWSRAKLVAQAQASVAKAQRASVFALSPTTLYHRTWFDSGGFWVQSGGIFGKSDRSDPVFRPSGFTARITREISRLRNLRGFIE